MLKELCQYIETGPSGQSHDIVRRMRVSADVGTIVGQIHGELLLQAPLAPEVKFRFEFPYRNQMPAAILKSENEYLGSFMYEIVCAQDRLVAEGKISSCSNCGSASSRTWRRDFLRIT